MTVIQEHREYNFDYANFVNLVYFHREELECVGKVEDLNQLFNKREISKLRKSQIIITKEFIIKKHVLSKDAAKILKDETWSLPLELNKTIPDSFSGPLRTCDTCGLEAWNEEGLEKFAIKTGNQYGKKNRCKKCVALDARKRYARLNGGLKNGN